MKKVFTVLFLMIFCSALSAQTDIEELAAKKNISSLQEDLQKKLPSPKETDRFFMTGNIGAGFSLSRRGLQTSDPKPTYEAVLGYRLTPRFNLALSYQNQREAAQFKVSHRPYEFLGNSYYRETQESYHVLNNHIAGLKSIFSLKTKNFSSGGSIQPFLGVGLGFAWWTNNTSYFQYSYRTYPLRIKTLYEGPIILGDFGLNLGSGALSGTIGLKTNVFGAARMFSHGLSWVNAQIVPYCGVKIAF